MDDSGAYRGRQTTWAQSPGGGGWWNPAATISLFAPPVAGYGALSYQWTITDGTHTFVKTGANFVMVSIAELIAAGFATPSAPTGAWATIGLVISDPSSCDTGTGYDSHTGGGVPLFLPEPGSMIVLALGAAGALRRRRR
jgi:hypothetical protein